MHSHPSKHSVRFDFKYDRPDVGKGGTRVLPVDGKEAPQNNLIYQPVLMTIDEAFDVGVVTRTGADDSNYQPRQKPRQE